jgi:hypothetical protein
MVKRKSLRSSEQLDKLRPMQKTCPECKEEKPIEDFSWKNRAQGKRSVYCKRCMRLRVRAHYAANREKYLADAYRKRAELVAVVREAKDRPCQDCGLQYPYYVMDFDHREDKQFNIASYRNVGIRQLRAEIVKCDVVCANCHRIRTHARNTLPV